VGYRGIVKGQVIVLDEGVTLKEGTAVEVIPIQEPPRGRATALVEVWGSDVPDEGWDAVERAIEELDRADREYERKQSHAKGLSV
jgi:hypothetical protein